MDDYEARCQEAEARVRRVFADMAPDLDGLHGEALQRFCTMQVSVVTAVFLRYVGTFRRPDQDVRTAAHGIIDAMLDHNPEAEWNLNSDG